MEMRRYLEVLRRRWKLVALTTLAAATVSWYFASQQVSQRGDVYEASNTYFLRAAPTEDADAAVRATSALNQEREIGSTYARIATSERIEDRAKAKLTTQELETSGLSATGQVIPGTNVIEITTRGPDPEAVAAYAAAIGDETAQFLTETGAVYELEQLDTAQVPDEPEPTNAPLDVAIGTILGLGAGAALAFSHEYLDGTLASSAVQIIDPRTGAHNRQYLERRLQQELSRCNVPREMSEGTVVALPPTKVADRRAPRGTLAVLRLAPSGEADDGIHPGPAEIAIRDMAQILMSRLREHDILAHLGDDRFAVLFPDAGAEEARDVLGAIEQDLRMLRIPGSDGGAPSLEIHLCEYDARGVAGDDESIGIARAL